MGAEEAINLFNSFPSILQQIGEDLIVTAANDSIALTQERIQTTGKKADGTNLSAYTEAYKKRKQNSSGIKGVVKKGSSRYKGFTDYTLTGRMFSSINARVTQNTPELIEVTIGAGTEEDRNKLKGLAKRDNHNPLAPSKEEIELLRDVFQEEGLRRIKQLFR